MTSSTPTRRLTIAGAYNLRDVGGYAVDGGGVTRWGRQFRSDLPHLTAADGNASGALRLRTVLDLRDDDECTARPSTFGGADVRLVRRPLGLRALIDDVSAEDTDPLGALFCRAAQQRGRQIAAAVTELGRPGALPALVHCTAGKDRTGIVIALTLGGLGVPDEVIAGDYALSSTYLTGEYFAAAAHVPDWPGRADLARLRRSEPASMLRLLDQIRTQDGTVRDYLLRHGASSAALAALRAALVEPSGPHQPLPAPALRESPVKIVHITDTHLSHRDGVSRDNFDRTVEYVNDHLRPDLVVHTGDIVILDPDCTADRDRAHALMGRFTAPVLVVPGNHDVGEPGAHPWQGIGVTDARVAAFEQVWGPGHWRHDAEGWSVLGINSELLGSGLERETAQWRWLEQTVADLPADRPVLLFLHKPIWPAEEPSDHALDVGDGPRTRLLELLDRVALKGVGCGHRHFYRRTERGEAVEVWGPSTAYGPGATGEHLPAGIEPLGVIEWDCDTDGVRVAFRAPPGLADVPAPQAPELTAALAEIHARTGAPA